VAKATFRGIVERVTTIVSRDGALSPLYVGRTAVETADDSQEPTNRPPALAGAWRHETKENMSGYRQDTFSERLKTANEAKKKALEKFKAQPKADDPEVAARRAEREAIHAAREVREAERRAAREAEAARKAAEAKAEEEARWAREAAEKEAEEARQKAARDARYAARKAAKAQKKK
jgi:hypothetical protein